MTFRTFLVRTVLVTPLRSYKVKEAHSGYVSLLSYFSEHTLYNIAVTAPRFKFRSLGRVKLALKGKLVLI